MQLLKLLKFVWRHPLNKNAKGKALIRVAKWQLASRMLAGPIALPFVEGAQLFAIRGMTGATGNWYCGLHEVIEMGFVLHLLRQSDFFLDVGANIGSYSILAAAGVGARVTAVEPIPETFAYLEKNVILNGFAARVRTCCMGLSDAASTVRFTSTLDTVNHVMADGEVGSGVDVSVMRLDDLVSDDVPVLIKIDVEGHERAVLLGGEKTLEDSRLLAVIMETNGSGARYGIADDELVIVMSRHGFRPYGYDPFRRCLLESNPTDGNTIFIRDEALVIARINAAKRCQLINGTI